MASGPSGKRSPSQPIAPVWHTGALIVGFVGLGLLVWAAAHAATHVEPREQSSILKPQLYLVAILFEWASVGFVWLGIRKRITIRELVGGRWPNAESVLQDVMLGLGFWALWEVIFRTLDVLLHFGPPLLQTPNVHGVVQNLLEVAFALSCGICEEIVFRGYLQTQISVLSGSVVTGICAQAVVFACCHLDLGLPLAGMTGLMAVLLGLLTTSRRSLRPGMIGHALLDISARLLRI